MNLCPFCMRQVQEAQCPHCGNPVSYSGDPMHLQAGHVLHGKHFYILGAALGQGGFGITYIALDMENHQRVAVKEYFPTYCAGRADRVTVTPYRGQEEVFQKGRERFLDEARMLKSLSDLNSIVNVLDFFETNHSAYLVMEFLEGDSLKAHAQKHGKFPAQTFLKQLCPLMEDIERMHQRGVVHRDIAPDNIILTLDGQMKLIDFGAARSYVGDKSMTVVVKKGFAPIEQYMRHGSTAATDVYALAATIYYCITGTVPPDSAERQYDEEMLKSPISLGAELSKVQEEAIVNALEVQPKKRTQTVAALVRALENISTSEECKPVRQELKTEEKKAAGKINLKKKVKRMIPAVTVVLLCIVGSILFMDKEEPVAPAQTEPVQVAVPETTVPETEPPVILSEEAQKYNKAVGFFNHGEYGKAAIAFAQLGDYRDAKELSRVLWDSIAQRSSIAAGKAYTVAVKEDGTVFSCGDFAPKVSGWKDIIAVSNANETLIGLRGDGTVVCANAGKSWTINTEGWTDIVAVSGDCHFAFGLKSDGTVVASRICDHVVQEEAIYLEKVAGLQNVVKIDAMTYDEGFRNFPLLCVLTADGTVMHDFKSAEYKNVSDMDYNLLGLIMLQENGTVIFQSNTFQKGTDIKKAKNMEEAVSSWRDVTVVVGRTSNQILGLKADGTVLATGSNSHGQCDVVKWKNIVSVDTAYNHSVGLKSDGNLVTCGGTQYRARKTADWKEIRIPADPTVLRASIHPQFITE